MIQANELRIGNAFKHKQYGFVLLTKDDFVNFNLNDLNPIPITEEWLVNFGFEPCNLKQRFRLGKLTYNISSGWFFGNKKIPKQKYIHQLQNTHFALTQKELEYVGTN